MVSPRRILVRAASVLLGVTIATAVQAADLRVALRKVQESEIPRYQALGEYLAKRGITLRFVVVAGYPEAAQKFGEGTVDAMFGGSGVSCAMMIKGVAEPFARFNYADAPDTYSAVVVARKGVAPFDGTAAWFAGKRVAFQPLASGGEFFFRSLGPSRARAILLASSHRAALEALGKGEADVAVVKNHVWTKEKMSYLDFAQVGQDKGVNPDGPMIVATKVPAEVRKKLIDALMALEGDSSPDALAAKKTLKIRGFSRATSKDFRHTMGLVQRSGVTKDFSYKF
jgi:ABC-type phosphate/phosphonate transport system substrate-binding protein